MASFTSETVRLYRIETPSHRGPFSSEESTVISSGHMSPREMELTDAVSAAVDSGDYFYFFSKFERLAEVFSIVKDSDSTFRVVYIDVPIELERVKMFCLDDRQVILDSNLYLNYFEQGEVVVCEDLTQQITVEF